MQRFEDVVLTCQCGEEFIWTRGEQAFMHRLLDSGKIETLTQPRRCKECRKKRKMLTPRGHDY